MHKTTSLQDPSTLLLLLLVLAATTSTTANSSQDEQEEEEPEINLSMVDIHNDLPPNAPRLFVVGSFQSSEALIYPGTSYNFVAGGERETGLLILDNNTCVDFVTFDPNVDLGHQAVLWSVRVDGAYHSWDRTNWQKKASWQPRSKCV